MAQKPSARPGPRLLWEAGMLLALIPELRATAFVPDVARLNDQLAVALRDFHARATRDGIEPRRVLQATEVLAATLDHVARHMPWGDADAWRSLGATQDGGQAAAQRLLEIANRTFGDAGMHELIEVAVALGLEGPASRSDPQLGHLRAQLSAHASQDAKPGNEVLTPELRPAIGRAGALSGWLPLWVSTAVVAALLAALFFGLEVSLAVRSDRLYARIEAINGPATTAPKALPAEQSRLTGVLSDRLAARQVVARDEIDRSVIVVPGSQLFARSSASLLPDAPAVLRPIAAALVRFPGRVRIIAHAGGELSPTARYPSNWDLAVERARMVRDNLRDLGVAGPRLTFDGSAIVAASDETSAHGPSDDGSVEILLLAGR